MYKSLDMRKDNEFLKGHQIIAFILFITLAASASANTTLSSENIKKINQFINDEILRVKVDIEYTQNAKGTIWAESDLEFFRLLLEGLNKDKANKFDDAIILYKKALKVKRHELSTFGALLNLGRTYLLNNNCKASINTLRDFINNAEDELAGPFDSGWTPTAEFFKAIQKDIDQARWLIDLCSK